MGDHFLAKIKGFNRTFAIRSSGPYAAAAAMGMMAARSQMAGPYFRVSDVFIPNVEGLVLEEENVGANFNQIQTDFKSDWVTYLRDTALPSCDLQYRNSCTPEQNTLRFLNAFRRSVLQIKPRITHKSRELTIPAEYLPDYDKLVALIHSGCDIKPYLSRAVLSGRSDKNDGLLNSWGIHHLHFRPEGTDQLLFCVITDTDVFLILVLPHNDWVNTQLIQILHDNWPTLIAAAKNNGLQQEAFSSSERSSLRRYNANFTITVSDGTIYLPPTGGTMASGDLYEDRVNCDKIFSELQYWEGFITREAPAIRTAIGLAPEKRLVVRMAYQNRVCCFYEATRGIRLGGFAL